MEITSMAWAWEYFHSPPFNIQQHSTLSTQPLLLASLGSCLLLDISRDKLYIALLSRLCVAHLPRPKLYVRSPHYDYSQTQSATFLVKGNILLDIFILLTELAIVSCGVMWFPWTSSWKAFLYNQFNLEDIYHVSHFGDWWSVEI